MMTGHPFQQDLSDTGDRSLCANGTTYRDRSGETHRLIDRILTSSASVIGIAGPRGAGKSSLAQHVLDACRKRGVFAHLVHSPTGYEPRAFLVAIFQSVCEQVVVLIDDELKRSHLLTEPIDAERKRLVLFGRFVQHAMMLVALLLSVAFAYRLYFWPDLSGDPGAPNSRLGDVFELLAPNIPLLILAIVSAWISIRSRKLFFRRISILTYHRSAVKLRDHAVDLSEHLRFQTNHSNAAEAKVSFLKAFFSFSSTKSLSARELSLPGLTSQFSSFLKEISGVYEAHPSRFA